MASLIKISAQQRSQAGVTLLLSVLVLAAITAIAFSLAAIVAIDIRAGTDFLRTEPALYAVQSVTEEAIFNYKRNPPTFNYLSSLNDVTLTTPTVISNAGSPTTQTIAANNGYQKYQLVDPNNLYDSAHYGKIRITYVSGNGEVSIQLKEIDPGNCGSSSTFNATIASPNDTWSQVLNGCLQYELKLTNAGTQQAQVTISTFADDSAANPPDGTPKGLPYIGSVVLEITAKYLGLSRKYQVTVPLGSSQIASAINFRYLKIDTQVSNSWVAWDEVEVYDANSNKVTPSSETASSSYLPPTFSPDKAVDGNVNTFWNAGGQSGNITFDYGSVIAVSQIRLLTENNPSPEDATHNVYISNDGVSYTMLTSFSGPMTTHQWLTYP